jgi:hypothetical protein
MSKTPHLTGFTPGSAHHGGAADPPALHPLPPEWMSEELIRDTARVWSSHSGQPISRADAVEILTNVRRLAEVLLRVRQNRSEP